MIQNSREINRAQQFGFLWGGCFALAISGSLERLLSSMITICCAFLVSVLVEMKMAPGMYLTGIILWLCGYVTGNENVNAAGMTLAGAGFCRMILHVATQLPALKRDADNPVPSGKHNRTGPDNLIRKAPEGGYEINIYELAAVISGKKACAQDASFRKSVKEEGKAEPDSALATGPISCRTDFVPVSQAAKVILKEFVIPWIREQALLDGIVCLLRILDNNSDSPSVVFEDSQLSQGEPYNVQYEALHRISLGDHTLHVVQEGFAVTRNRFGDTGLYTIWPRLVISCIAHDIGKISGLRMDHGYARLDHPGISAGIVKECLVDTPGLAEECSDIVRHHHGEPPAGFPYAQGLEILKRADAKARNRELQKALGHLKPWKDIPPEIVAKELAAFMLNAIRSGDMARDLFYLNQKKGLLYINPDVLIEILQSISRDNYLWPEIFARDSTMTEKALRDFLADRLRPEGWLTDNFTQDRFLWLKIDKMGKITGPRPFVEILFMKFVQAAGITPSEIVEPWRKSFLGKCLVISE